MRRLLINLIVAVALLVAAAPAAADNGLIAGGYFHSCGVKLDGAAKCWGGDDQGQLGNGSAGASSTAVSVDGAGSGVTAISGGFFFSCAVVEGAAKCWGADDEGQLGNGAAGASTSPVQVEGLTSGVSGITVGDANACAVVNGGIKCWGRGADGQLGNGGGSSTVPVDVSGITAGSGATVVATGSSHTCAVVSGAAKCWGLNGSGRLGNGSVTASPTPVDVTGLTSGVTDVSVGLAHSCAVVAGAAKCWGFDSSGQVGNGPAGGTTTPTDVTGLSSGVTTISAGYYFTCAVASGAGKCWGSNSNWQLGDPAMPATSTTPLSVSGLDSGVESIGAGAYHVCARVSGSGKCWGQNTVGALGNGTTDQSATPVGVTGFGESTPPPSVNNPLPIPPALPEILSSPKKVKAGKKIALKLRCETGCTLALALKIGKKTVSGIKAVKLGPASTTYNIKIPSKPAKKIKAALKKSKKTKIVLTITPSSAQGTGAAKRVSIVR